MILSIDFDLCASGWGYVSSERGALCLPTERISEDFSQPALKTGTTESPDAGPMQVPEHI